MNKTALVFNHFAVRSGGAGGTRHDELFAHLPEDWDHLIIAADRNNLTRSVRQQSSASVLAVPSTPFDGRELGRVANWVSYAAGAFIAGVTRRTIDVVYGSTPHLLTGLVAWAVARIRRVPFVLEVRDLWPQVLVDMDRLQEGTLVHRLLSRIERLLYRNADAVVVLAAGSKNHVVAIAPDTPVYFIPNGSDPATWTVDVDRADLRSQHDLHGLVCVYAGAHGGANGLDAVLDAAADLPDVTFVLVGDGLDKPRLVDAAGRRSLENVRFLDARPKPELAELFAAADVGLHVLADVPVFRYGVSPNKIFDYMAAGLPIVTNCPGEVTDLVEMAGAGVATAPDDVASGVAAMAELGPAGRVELGDRGRSFVAEHRSRVVLAEDLAAVLDDVTT